MPDGGPSGSSEQSNEPWSVAQPFLQRGYEEAERQILDRPTEFFPGSTVVPFAPETMMALGGQSNRAMMGSPLLPQSQGYTGDVLSGAYLSPENNPFLGGVTDAVLSQVQPQVAASFGMAGHGAGSPLASEALGRGVSRGMAPYLFGEYGRERGIQERAAERAPYLAREDYFDIGQLGAVGATREAQAQRELGDQIQRWEFAQQEPPRRTMDYLRAIQGIQAYPQITTESSTSPGIATGVGLGLQGLSTFAPMIFGMPGGK